MSGETELIGGREQRPIEIVPYDASWRPAFMRERARIAHALGPRAVRIDHIGSIAVEGLPAKPAIDIDVSVADPGDEASYVPAFELGPDTCCACASPGIGCCGPKRWTFSSRLCQR
jgi:hypothetical protein